MWRSSIQAWMPVPSRRRRGVGSFFVYRFSRVESPSERYPPSVGGGGLSRHPEHMVRVVVGIEVFARERTLHCFLGRKLGTSSLPSQGGGIATQPLHSWGSPTPSAGRKSEVAASPLPSWGPKRGRNCYATLAFSGVPNAKRGEKIRIVCLTTWHTSRQCKKAPEGGP